MSKRTQDQPKSLMPNIPVEIQILLVKIMAFNGLFESTFTAEEKKFLDKSKKYIIAVRNSCSPDLARLAPNPFNDDVIDFLFLYKKEKEKWPNPFYPGYPEIKCEDEISYHILKNKKNDTIHIFRYKPNDESPYYDMTRDYSYSIESIYEKFVYGGMVDSAIINHAKRINAD